MTTQEAPAREFTLTRILEAPRELVFQAWTDPRHLQWFFSDTMDPSEPIHVDLRVGGVWRQRMVVDENTEYITGGVYREIVPVERLVFVWGASDGWTEVDPASPEDGPVVTVTFNEVDSTRTEMVFHLTLPDHLSDDRARELLETGMRDGWGQTIDRLVASFAPGR